MLELQLRTDQSEVMLDNFNNSWLSRKLRNIVGGTCLSSLGNDNYLSLRLIC